MSKAKPDLPVLHASTTTMFVGWLKSHQYELQGYPNVPAADDRCTRRATIDRFSTWGGSDDIFRNGAE
jgi:hypothetical protein